MQRAAPFGNLHDPRVGRDSCTPGQVPLHAALRAASHTALLPNRGFASSRLCRHPPPLSPRVLACIRHQPIPGLQCALGLEGDHHVVQPVIPVRVLEGGRQQHMDCVGPSSPRLALDNYLELFKSALEHGTARKQHPLTPPHSQVKDNRQLACS